MKFFLDTANLAELRTGVSWGIVDGVTTNPTLIAKEGKPFEEHIREICDIVDGDIGAEVVETESGPMIKQGRELAKIHKNAVVKCPLTREGVKATSALSAMPFKAMDMLFNYPLTDKGPEQFLKDWHKTFQEEPAVR